jgi:SAM-dependent methyltransferase
VSGYDHAVSDDAPGVGWAANRYGTLWRPANEAEARLQIVTYDDRERFEASGRQELVQLLPYLDPEATVLDLGCGIGRIARYVAPHCHALWAVDASGEMLEMAAQLLAEHPNVRYARCEDTRVPAVPDASIDFAYSIIVLQHLEKEDAFLLVEDVARMLCPGGRALFTWPNLLDEFYLDTFLTYAHRGEVTNPARARMYTTTELECLLPCAGFSAVEVRPAPNIVTICTR